jgi:hypothetical protein
MKGNLELSQQTMREVVQSGLKDRFYPSELPKVGHVWYDENSGLFVVQVSPQPKKAK